MSENNAFIHLVDALRKELAEKQTLRPKLQYINPTTREQQWIVHERDAMFEAVNRERRKLDKEPVKYADIKAAEQQAVGHSDYSPKFALYCAELVYDRFYKMQAAIAGSK